MATRFEKLFTDNLKAHTEDLDVVQDRIVTSIDSLIADGGNIDDLLAIHSDTQEPNGFIREQPDTMGDNSYDSTTGYIRIFPKSGQPNFQYYVDGIKHTETGTKSITLDTTVNGIRAIYFREDGELYEDVTPGGHDMFMKYALVAIVYYNTDSADTLMAADERHGITMSGATHYYLHFTSGAVYYSGLALSGLTTTGQTTYTGIDAGVIFDEDIKHEPAAQTDIPFWYIKTVDIGDGAGAIDRWYMEPNASTTVPQLGWLDGTNTPGTDNLYYNLNTAGVWALDTVTTSNDYALVHILTTNDRNHPSVAVLGQNKYSKISDARDGAATELANLTTLNLPGPEIVDVATYILDGRGGLEPTELLGTDYWIDWRYSSATGTSSPSSHSTLADLSTSGHPASVIATDTSSFNGQLSTADTTTQKALDTLDNYTVWTAVSPGDANHTASFGQMIVWPALALTRTMYLPNITASDIGKEIMSVASASTGNFVVYDPDGTDTINGYSTKGDNIGTNEIFRLIAITTTMWRISKTSF